MLRGTLYHGGVSLDPGQEYEVDEKHGRIFVQLGKAVRVEAAPVAAPQTIDHADPAPATRDPRPRRGHATR